MTRFAMPAAQSLNRPCITPVRMGESEYVTARSLAGTFAMVARASSCGGVARRRGRRPIAIGIRRGGVIYVYLRGRMVRIREVCKTNERLFFVCGTHTRTESRVKTMMIHRSIGERHKEMSAL